MEIPTVTQHDNDDDDCIVEDADNVGDINDNNNVEVMIPDVLSNVTMVTQQYTSDFEEEDEDENEDEKDEMEEERRMNNTRLILKRIMKT